MLPPSALLDLLSVLKECEGAVQVTMCEISGWKLQADSEACG